MTEDEAKTKECCGPRAAGLGEDIKCIGSACMAWRVQQDVATETRRSSQRPAGDGWLPGEGYDDWTRTRAVVLGGYCGLAGASQ